MSSLLSQGAQRGFHPSRKPSTGWFKVPPVPSVAKVSAEMKPPLGPPRFVRECVCLLSPRPRGTGTLTTHARLQGKLCVGPLCWTRAARHTRSASPWPPAWCWLRCRPPAHVLQLTVWSCLVVSRVQAPLQAREPSGTFKCAWRVRVSPPAPRDANLSPETQN